MKTVLRTVAIFATVALGAFVAADPTALPPHVNAGIAALIAGLAAIGITPPHAEKQTVNYNITPPRTRRPGHDHPPEPTPEPTPEVPS